MDSQDSQERAFDRLLRIVPRLFWRVVALGLLCPAGEAGLRRGDIIVEVDRQEIASVQELRKRLENSKDSVLMLIQRGEATLFVPVKRS